MIEEERAALQALNFDRARVPDDVWRPSRFHVDGLHPEVVHNVVEGIAEADKSVDGSPIGVVLQGPPGSGKTHMLGWVRQHTQQLGGYFFLVSLLDSKGFWDSVLASMLDGLARPVPGSETQLHLLLRRLSSKVGAPRLARRAFMGDTNLTRETLDAFIHGLLAYDPYVGRNSQDTARALALSASDDVTHQDLADGFFALLDEAVPGERAAWGMRRMPKTSEEIVQELSRLLSMTGPTVIAVDQIDTLIAQYAGTSDAAARAPEAGEIADSVALEQVAGGLMTLRERTRRTLTVLSCIPATWARIRTKATSSVADRFRITSGALSTIKDNELGRAIVEKRFAVRFEEIGFHPPYPTWPVSEKAFAKVGSFTPRALLKEIDEHIRSCLLAGEVRELTQLGETRPPVERRVPDVGTDDLELLDARFVEFKRVADVVRPLTGITEDVEMPALLAAGLDAWIQERGEAGERFSLDPPPSSRPALHARLRLTLDEDREDQVHWSFRAISDGHHGNAVLSRLRKACNAAGLDAQVPKRKLFVLRDRDMTGGPKMRETVAAFGREGGTRLPLDVEDLRILFALRMMLQDPSADLRAWLVARRPTRSVAVFQTALADADVWLPVHDITPAAPVTMPDQPVREAPRGGPAAASGGPPIALPGRGVGAGDRAAAFGDRTAEAERQLTTADDRTDGRVAATQTLGRLGAASFPTGGMPTAGNAGPGGGSGNLLGVRSAAGSGERSTPVSPAAGRVPRQAVPESAGTAAFTIGHRHDSGVAVPLELEALRKHLTIFAGSGSGKTVLIRRIVEECALRGVSSIVLDLNNDLARLGDAWPEEPAAWGEGDAARAADYLANTDVVIWTPRRDAGRPLSFQPLPDFMGVRDDPDEFNEAVESAVASLAPRALLGGRSVKSHLGLAVLRKAVEHYGRQGGNRLQGLVATLNDFPEDVIDLADSAKIAGQLAEALTAAMVNDPLFGGGGTAMDPGLLLTPTAGKRARVSVISMVGLGNDDVRQSFVNQLQMALFAWIKRNPAGDRPLGGLLIMDEAQNLAPSGAMTACTQSTLALASQARKYGLGLIFATQSPKGLHNRIPGNAATQLYGRLNSPIQMDTAREMAKAKGGDVPDIARLTSGEFYLAAEGAPPRKLRTPLCLTHHPASPLSTEEVVTRAAAR
ncbi:helicase HerA domain-containing protein [Catenuloplanes sp. NPDC051500]|uniref:ATP-binding protein n=1 Tax=Catenuloplanes sp. NPDC051500 TaxID=3363959 RepID=UPI00379B3CB6